MYTSKSSLEVAVEAAARVDAVLAKKGKIKPNPIAAALTNSSKTCGDLFSTEFEINDVPLTARNLLTKGITQEEINHFSGASISTRGRYIQPDEKPKGPGDRSLYLFIQGPNKQSLDLAIQRIDSLIKEVMEQEKFKAGPPPPLMSIQTSLPGIEKVLVGLDGAPPTFDVRSKVIGPGGANLQYISNETGAIVTLRGRGSGFIESNGQESPEPLHLCVEHQKFEVLQAGRQLAFNLIETIQQEYMQTHPQHPPPIINNLVLPQGQVQTVSLQPGEQLGPSMVATSISLPMYTQQSMGQVVNVPPPSMAIPPPQMLQQPPPQVASQQIPPQQLALPPPGVHIPPHQGPLVPPQQGMIHQHQVLQQPPPNMPPPGTVMAGTPPGGQPSVSVAQPAQHTIQQQVIVSQGGSIVTHPPPTMTVGTGHQVLPPNSVITTPTHQPQAFITHATYPVQYIQANGQTLMAYPGVMRQDGQAQVQLLTQTSQGPPTSQAHLVQGQLPPVLATNQPPPQAQIQPGVVLQTGQTQQIQLAQLMQSHLINQGQPQAVTMLLQYQQQQGVNIGQNQGPQGDVRGQLQQTRLGSTIVQGHQRLATPVQIQLQSGQQMQVINPQVQLQQPGGQPAQPGVPQIQYQPMPQHQFHQQPQVQQVQIPGPQPQFQHQPAPQMQQVVATNQQHQLQLQQQMQLQQQQQQPVATQQGQHQLQQSPQHQTNVRSPHQNTSPNGQNQNRSVQIQNQVQAHLQVQGPQMQPQPQMQGSPQMQVPPNQQSQQQSVQHQNQQQEMQLNQVVMQPNQGSQQQQQQQIRSTMTNASPHGQKRRYEGEENKSNSFQGLPQPVPPPKVHSSQQQQQTQQQQPTRGIGDASGNIGQANSAQAVGNVAPAGSPANQPPRDKSLMPPPPPPQGGVPDDWQNSQNEQQMKQVNRGDIKNDPKRGRMAPGNGYELEREAADNRAVVNRNDRPTFNHYSSKPQMYNANLPFHMHGLGMYPPPPPPPPPPPGQFPYYQQPQQHPTHNHTAIPPQYPYWMMPQ